MVTTPCPYCAAPVPVRGEQGDCPACGKALRFIDVPERPCACGGTVPEVPGSKLLRCLACGAVQPADVRRRVRHVATCPRCRRRIDVPATGSATTCPHCDAALRLQDTL